MKHKQLNNTYLSMFCSELAMLLDAGLTVSDGLQILLEDEQHKDSKTLMQGLVERMSDGSPFSSALISMAVFPRYMIYSVEIGEKTGRTVETLKALSEYYDRQVRLAVTIRSSVLYPAILLVLMVLVVLILIVQVLPIFNEVFTGLGTQMSPVAITLMNFGRWLGDASVVIAIVICAIVVIAILMGVLPAVRKRFTSLLSNIWGDSGVFGKIASSRFVYAMTLAMASGLNMESSIDIAANVSGGSKAVDKKHKLCADLLGEGKPLSDALCGAGLLTVQEAKMLSIGGRSGKSEEAMAEIARRSDLNVQDNINRIVSRIEPTLVIISSVVVGIILLSVMLPLISIAAAIGFN